MTQDKKFFDIFRNSRGSPPVDSDGDVEILGLYDIVSYLNYHFDVSKSTMVEVGIYAGQSTHIFSQYFKKVHAVDPWKDHDEYEHKMSVVEGVFDRFKAPNVIKHKKTSLEAAKDIKDKSIDFIYIDARHEYEYVMEDIKVWLPKLKDSGWMGGHDFYLHEGHINQAEFGVAKAVMQNFNIDDVITFQDCSWVVKPINPPDEYMFISPFDEPETKCYARYQNWVED